MGIRFATMRNLELVLAQKPKILHFICHGDYDKEKKKYFLLFEDDNGCMVRFYE